jgi:hypothetical protein
MKFDVSSVGIGMGAQRKKQARIDLMAQGSSPQISDHVSTIAKRLLCSIVEALARLAIKFSTCAQPGSNSTANFVDLKLKLSRCRWAWHEPAQPNKTVTEYDTSADDVERCLAQRRSAEAFAYLKHIITLHDKPVSLCLMCVCVFFFGIFFFLLLLLLLLLLLQ